MSPRDGKDFRIESKGRNYVVQTGRSVSERPSFEFHLAVNGGKMDDPTRPLMREWAFGNRAPFECLGGYIGKRYETCDIKSKNASRRADGVEKETETA
jgi:hypothetical protein